VNLNLAEMSLAKSRPSVPLRANFITFCIAFHIFVAGIRRHFTFGVWVEHSKSQPTDDKPSLKFAWSRHVAHFKF